MADREKYIIDDDEDEDNDNAQSDLVRMILNLAFLHESKAKTFTFSKDTYKAQMKGLLGNMLGMKKNSLNWQAIILHWFIF